MAEASRRELLACVLADLIAGSRHVAVGAASPLPAAAALLARALSGGRMRVSLLGSRRHNPFTDGSRELFDCAAQGRLDAFFLSGAQIDRQGNVNLLGLGTYPQLARRFAGCFGAPFMAFMVPNLILFREDHDPKVLVDRVDFITAPGHSDQAVWRRGGPRWLLTGAGLFRFAEGRFELVSLHPGETLAGVRERTGFAFSAPDAVPATPQPAPAQLDLLRGPVRDALAEVYPGAAQAMHAAD
jgi:glutaconate CoA-transferase subunit B